MPATDGEAVRRERPAAPPIAPGAEALSAEAWLRPCPNQATCKSPLCRGGHVDGGCPGSRKGS